MLPRPPWRIPGKFMIPQPQPLYLVVTHTRSGRTLKNGGNGPVGADQIGEFVDGEDQALIRALFPDIPEELLPVPEAPFDQDPVLEIFPDRLAEVFQLLLPGYGIGEEVDGGFVLDKLLDEAGLAHPTSAVEGDEPE